MTFQTKHEPPTADEMLTYLQGGLTAEEEASFRSRVVWYPELVRALVAPFPEAANPGDSDYLSDDEFARRTADFFQRTDSVRKFVPFWRTVAAIAAAVAALFGAMLWRAEVDRWRPHVISAGIHRLRPDLNARGVGSAEPIAIEPADDTYALMPLLTDDDSFDSYRLELFDAHGDEHLVWSGKDVRRKGGNELLVLVPRAFVRPGVYRLSVSGVAGGRAQHLNDYTVRFVP